MINELKMDEFIVFLAVFVASTVEVVSEYLAFLGIFVGVLLRTLLPALRKALEATEEEPFEWDHTYTLTAVASVFIALLVAAVAFPTFTIPEGSDFIVFISALAFSMGLNSLINEASQWLGLSPS